MKSFKVIIIDDNIQANRPLIVQIKEKYGAENVKLFNLKRDADGTPTEGLNYLLDKENIKEPTVLLLDVDLGSNSVNGFEVVKKVREQTALLQIIMMSAQPKIIKAVSKEEWIELINNHAMAFLDTTTDTKTKIEYIEKARRQMETRVDCVLENWIAGLGKEERNKPIYASRKGQQWTFDDVLREIREQSDEGTRLEKNIIKLTLSLIARGKRPIEDADA
jgi:FixJ family two-component response regulator